MVQIVAATKIFGLILIGCMFVDGVFSAGATQCYSCNACSGTSNTINCSSGPTDTNVYSCYKRGASVGSLISVFDRGCIQASNCTNTYQVGGIAAGQFCCSTSLCNFSTSQMKSGLSSLLIGASILISLFLSLSNF